MAAESGSQYISATPAELCLLAAQYQYAAKSLWRREERRKKHKPVSWAPYRFCAIHAVELYLNAFLLFKGMEEDQVRGLQHDLTERALLTKAQGLNLRTKTNKHLDEMADSREYLMTRYNPKMKTVSQINRMDSTLQEVAQKVTLAIKGKQSPAVTKKPVPVKNPMCLRK